jgi:hypothetical protein
MKRLFTMALVLALASWLLAACGGSSVGAGDVLEENADDQVFWPDNGGTEQEEEQAPVACTSDSDCLQKMGAPAACKGWKCDGKANACVSSDLDNGLSCDDHNACTENDACLNGVCLGDGKDCNDDNPCTTDDCVATTADGCVHTDNQAACNDGDLCTLDDHCQAGKCTGDMDPKCVCTTDADCKPFDDGDLCNGVKVCLGNQCVTKEGSIVDCSGVAAGPCETVACEPTSGECKKGFKADGVECTDGSFCTINDACKGGLCEGTSLKCDDGNVCTDDSCDPDSGCVNSNNTKPCDDGKLCTNDDACLDGACAGTDNPDCQCDSDAACAPFDDGDLCNGTMKCIAGACQADSESVVSCDSAQAGPCEEVYCETSSGDCKIKHALDGTKCDDGDKCTSEGVCADGTCIVTAIQCDDGNLCTDDGCDKAIGCTHANNTKPCDDGNTCTTGDACAAGACKGTAQATCTCVSNKDCQDDGNLCNGLPSCVSGQCVVDPSSVVKCPEPKGCTLYTCEAKTGMCQESQAADGTLCHDGDKCSEKDLCQAGVCKAGEAVVCDDANLCTDDSCDPAAGCVHKYNNVECDDGNTCSTNDHCVEGACKGSPAAQCVCEQATDCAPYDDGNPCNGKLACVEHKCVADPSSEVTCPAADADGCKLSYCEPATGQCVNPDLPDGKPCDDHDACTLVDVCKAGVCTSSGAKVCNDDNPCTDDSCQAATGCVFAYNTLACDDGDPCTEGDACLEGVCQPGPTNTCAPSCQADWTLECGDIDAWSTLYPGATDNVDSYSCNTDLYSGPEYTYRFTAPYDGTLTVYLKNEADETDLLVLDDLGAGCDTKNCRAWDFSKVEVPMVAGKAYYFVVDGYLDAAGEYTIHLNCTPDHEVNCGDGVDNDLDGLIDCNDEADCLGTPECPIPQCAPDWTLACGGSDTWWNYGSGSTDLLVDYSCTDWSYEGPEYTYTFVSPVTGDVTIALSNLDADLDVVVLTAGGAGECLASACVAFSDQASTIDESVTFAATAGATYYVVVDGFMGAESGYTVTLTCPADVETNCANGADDDQDGATDCDDSDCAEDAACLPDYCAPDWVLECGDSDTYSTDSFGSTLVVDAYGCAAGTVFDGREYAYSFVAPYTGELSVTLSDATAGLWVAVVKAGAGDVCDPAAACLGLGQGLVTVAVQQGQTYYVVVDGQAGASGSFTVSTACVPDAEMQCADGLDDDLDGFLDCLDSDCFQKDAACPACTPVDQLHCEDVVTGSNGAVGSTNAVFGYTCNADPYFGPEYVYTFIPEQDGLASVDLSDETDETDVFVLMDTGACNPAACLDWDMSSVVFEVKANQVYYVVVDGWGPAEAPSQGNFTLTLSCVQ